MMRMPRDVFFAFISSPLCLSFGNFTTGPGWSVFVVDVVDVVVLQFIPRIVGAAYGHHAVVCTLTVAAPGVAASVGQPENMPHLVAREIVGVTVGKRIFRVPDNHAGGYLIRRFIAGDVDVALQAVAVGIRGSSPIGVPHILVNVQYGLTARLEAVVHRKVGIVVVVVRTCLIWRQPFVCRIGQTTCINTPVFCTVLATWVKFSHHPI